MRNCILGGDNFRAFRVDLGGQNSKGDNFQLYREKIELEEIKPINTMGMPVLFVDVYQLIKVYQKDNYSDFQMRKFEK